MQQEVNVPPLGDMPISGVTMTQWAPDPANIGKKIPVNQFNLPGITRTELTLLILEAIQADKAGLTGTRSVSNRAWAETYWRDRQAEWCERVGLKPVNQDAKPVKNNALKIVEP